MKPVIYTAPLSIHHNTGQGHPENADRLLALEALFLEGGYDIKQSQAAEIETVCRAHSEDYIYALMDAIPDAGLAYLDNDTVVSPASKHDVKKVAIIDFDVHHGNGTDQMVRHYNKNNADTPIFFASTHGYPLFPMTGDPDDNNAHILNHYLPDKCGSQDFREMYESKIFPALRRYEPDIMMLSSGFDAHKDDPLAQANLKSEDYGWLGENLSDIVSNKNIISVLEGGYNIEALVPSVKSHLEGL